MTRSRPRAWDLFPRTPKKVFTETGLLAHLLDGKRVQNPVPPLIKVVLASDNSRLIEQARGALATEKTIQIVAEVQEKKQFLDLLRRRRPTLTIIDLALPPAGAHPVLPQIRRRSPRTKVLAIDNRLDEGRVLGAVKAGVHGYMLEEAVPGYLPKAVRVMAAGEAWLSRKLTGKVVAELQRLARLQQRAPARRARSGATS